MANGDISNTTLYNLYAERLLPCLEEINKHLATLNGDVAWLKQKSKDHSQDLEDAQEKRSNLSSRMAVVEKVLDIRAEEVDRLRTDTELLGEKLWAVTKAVAELGTLVIVITKFLGLW